MLYLHHTSFGISVLGVLVIVYGVIMSQLNFLVTEVHALRGRSVGVDRMQLRHSLGYYLLLGLEFLIAADVIETLMKPTRDDLIVLAGMVLIRTVISHSLNSELKSETNSHAERPFTPNNSKTRKHHV